MGQPQRQKQDARLKIEAAATRAKKRQEGFFDCSPQRAPAKKRREKQERGTPLRMTALQDATEAKARGENQG
jgi:hypothetical protein